ncbi:MAG TPA: hypothetical protein VFK80_04205, partial [Limnochordia bacterium]|nr:hypothetical protein [Limnochordia bacterium]
RAPRGVPPGEAFYAEVGIKVLSAFAHCLDVFGEPRRQAPAIDAERLAQSVRQAAEQALQRTQAALQEDFGALRERLNRLEGVLVNLDAAVKRIDKFALDAFRNLGTLERDLGLLNERLDEIEQSGFSGAGATHRRLTKEQAAKLALQAGAKLKAEDERISLASVAREANLKYGQIMYAFGNKEAFEAELEAYLAKQDATDGESASRGESA